MQVLTLYSNDLFSFVRVNIYFRIELQATISRNRYFFAAFKMVANKSLNLTTTVVMLNEYEYMKSYI